jgi:signal transduction histidine kinase
MEASANLFPLGSEIFRTIERQRRLRLARILAPTFAVLQALGLGGNLFAMVRNGPPPLLTALGDVGSGVCFALFGLAVLFVRRAWIGPATFGIVTGAAIAILSPTLGWVYSQGVDTNTITGVASYAVIILLAGVLTGNGWITAGVTLLVNAFTVYIYLFAPRAQAVQAIMTRETSNMLPLALSAEWGFAVLLIAALRIYEPAFRELAQVRVAYQRAQKLDELKDQFISSVNHELRNPVMALLAYLEGVEQIGGDVLQPRLRQYVERAHRAGLDLRALIQSILDTRRMDQGADDFTPAAVNVRATLDTALALIDPREAKAAERDLHVRMPYDLAIWGETVRLQQILTNLISNAIKYSKPGTPIEIAAQIVHAPRKGQRGPGVAMAEITVRDYGLGIPPEEAPLLFQRFVRLPRDLASTTIGNGLGLFLCRVYAEAMGGCIWVESSGIEGEGSTFHLRLPLPPENAPPASAAEAPMKAGVR